MARSRNIKPGFFRNAELVELPVETRLLFIGLWTLADREGRLEDRPRQIKMEIYPADHFDVDPMLNQLQSNGFIVRYEVDGQKIIEVTNFVKHQDPHYKEKASALPPQPGKENLLVATGVTRTQRARILERDGYKCLGCGATESLCIDHIHPASRGGDSSDENLQVLCSKCNTRKGNKIEGETRNSRRRQVNVDPNMNQQKCSMPSDSLIPDSLNLIPDSLQKTSVAVAPKKVLKKNFDVERPEEVSEQVWKDWLVMRKAKKAAVTATVLNGARREAEIAGLPLDEFLSLWCQSGYQGFKASWIKPEDRKTTVASQDFFQGAI